MVKAANPVEKTDREGRAAVRQPSLRRALRPSRADLRLREVRRNRSRSIAISSGQMIPRRCANAGPRRKQIRKLPRDSSGVWRYREMLPFDDDAPFVTLFEGNTPLFHAPRSAKYCGLDRSAAKASGMQSDGLIQRYGHDCGHHAGRDFGRAHGRLREHGEHGGEPRGVCGPRGISSGNPAAARASVGREARAKPGLRRARSAKSMEISTIACA